jgi:hypothetical protein
MRPNLTIVLVVTGVSAFCLWRGLSGKPQSTSERPRTTVAAKQAGMSPSEWRYFNSQSSHWRQIMLKK